MLQKDVSAVLKNPDGCSSHPLDNFCKVLLTQLIKSQDHIINKKAMKCDDDVAEHESKELLPRVATGLFLTPQNSLPQAVELKTEQTSAAGRSPEANWCRYCSTLSTAFLAFAVRDSKLQMHGWNLVGVLLSVISIRAILRSVASLHCHDPLPDPERVQ